MWTVEHSVTTSAPAHEVWLRYQDTDTWPEWNAAVGAVRLDGPFATGTTGTLAPPDQEPLPFTLVSVTVDVGYVSETAIADTVSLRTSAALTPLEDGGTRITHRVDLVGPAADFFAQSFGPALTAGLPKTVAALAEAARPRALIVVTSHDQLGDTGRSTGAYLSEVSDAWQVFTAAGYRVELASVRGGKPPLEAVTADDPLLAADPGFLADSATPGSLDPARYRIIFVAGGHGAVWDLPDDKDLATLISTGHQNGAVVAAVCHGAAALINAVGPDGRPLVAGRRVAAFTNDEERAVGMTAIVPFLLADALVSQGAVHDSAPSFMPHTVVDGRLVTGQNPASAAAVAEAAVAVLRPATAAQRAT